METTDYRLLPSKATVETIKPHPPPQLEHQTKSINQARSNKIKSCCMQPTLHCIPAHTVRRPPTHLRLVHQLRASPPPDDHRPSFVTCHLDSPHLSSMIHLGSFFRRLMDRFRSHWVGGWMGSLGTVDRLVWPSWLFRPFLRAYLIGRWMDK